MDSCFADVFLEFLAVAFHNILYYTSVYPQNIFETRKKYNIVVFRSVHPDLNQYIDLCLKSIQECMKSGKLQRVEFAITDIKYQPILTFVFDFDTQDSYDETTDAYLILSEQNIRAFCLRLNEMAQYFKNLPEDRSFTIFLHTNESTAVSMAVNPGLEEFPMVEVQAEAKGSYSILPIRRFAVRQYNIDTYMEIR